MHKRPLGNILLLIAIPLLIYIVVLDRLEKKGPAHTDHVVKLDSVFNIDTVAAKPILKIKSVDSIIQSDRIKQRAFLQETKRIKDSIAVTRKQVLELKRSLELEKRVLKEKYEKHIDKIYESNCIQRGGPEDTLNNY
jgi:hypothetical protein